jgi:hypothetical protein
MFLVVPSIDETRPAFFSALVLTGVACCTVPLRSVIPILHSCLLNEIQTSLKLARKNESCLEDRRRARPCLVPIKFYKIFHIPHHIESLVACIEY